MYRMSRSDGHSMRKEEMCVKKSVYKVYV